jgi:transcription termination factor NusB
LNATPPSASPPESARSLAARVVTRVVDEGAFSSITLRYQLAASNLEGRDRGFTTELVYGTVTWLTPIDEALEAWMTQGLGSVPPLARAVLRVATYELLRPNRPGAAHAVVDAAVSQMHAIGLGRISGLTNAVLRKIARFGAPFAANPTPHRLRRSPPPARCPSGLQNGSSPPAAPKAPPLRWPPGTEAPPPISGSADLSPTRSE